MYVCVCQVCSGPQELCCPRPPEAFIELQPREPSTLDTEGRCRCRCTPVVQANNNSLSPVRCQLSFDLLLLGQRSNQASFDYSRLLLASATHRTSDQSRLAGLGERIFRLTRCYSTSSSPEPCPSPAAGTTTLESARPSTRVTVREVWEQSASLSCPSIGHRTLPIPSPSKSGTSSRDWCLAPRSLQ